MLAYVINTIIAAIITKYFTKISIHVWGISGPSVAILYAYGLPAFLIMLILAAIVGYSRIKLKAHIINQVIAAIIFSVLITILVIYGLKII
jgi:membrane-associated phospholipid phosphatase